MCKIEHIPKSFANIGQTIEKNNKKTEKITFFIKNSWYYPIFGLKKRYFS